MFFLFASSISDVSADFLSFEISNETTANSMKSCGFALPVYGSDDGLFSCFKKGKKCASGKAFLESQLKNF